VVFSAFSAGAVALAIPERYRKWALVVPLISVLPWIFHPTVEHVICWKESQVNSVARRAWTNAAAEYVREHYRSGVGIASPFGDLTGIYCKAELPLRQVLHEGNGPSWLAMLKRPDLLPLTKWAITQQDDRLSKALHMHTSYRVVTTIEVPKADRIEIWERIVP
jgi:hypothetical protein